MLPLSLRQRSSKSGSRHCAQGLRPQGSDRWLSSAQFQQTTLQNSKGIRFVELEHKNIRRIMTHLFERFSFLRSAVMRDMLSTKNLKNKSKRSPAIKTAGDFRFSGKKRSSFVYCEQKIVYVK